MPPGTGGTALCRHARTPLRASQLKLEEYEDSLRTELTTATCSVEEIREAIDAEWVEVESAFQSFLSTVRDRAETVREVVAARTQAQRLAYTLHEPRSPKLDALAEMGAAALETIVADTQGVVQMVNATGHRIENLGSSLTLGVGPFRSAQAVDIFQSLTLSSIRRWHDFRQPD